MGIGVFHFPFSIFPFPIFMIFRFSFLLIGAFSISRAHVEELVKFSFSICALSFFDQEANLTIIERMENEKWKMENGKSAIRLLQDLHLHSKQKASPQF